MVVQDVYRGAIIHQNFYNILVGDIQLHHQSISVSWVNLPIILIQKSDCVIRARFCLFSLMSLNQKDFLDILIL